MVDVNQAVTQASTHLRLLIPAAQKITLEEVEITEDDNFWLITLSFIDPNKEDGASLAHALSGRPHRSYRVIKLNRKTGELRSMKMRELQNA
jgi:hypothetical protein